MHTFNSSCSEISPEAIQACNRSSTLASTRQEFSPASRLLRRENLRWRLQRIARDLCAEVIQDKRQPRAFEAGVSRYENFLARPKIFEHKITSPEAILWNMDQNFL